MIHFQRIQDRFGRVMSLPDTDIYDIGSGMSIWEFIQRANLDLAKIKIEIDNKSTVRIVEDMRGRDNLTEIVSGSCCYIIENKTLYIAKVYSDKILWVEVARVDSLDLNPKWKDIKDKPESDIITIDDMVKDEHKHKNKETLDGINVNEETEKLEYKGVSLDDKTGIIFKQDGKIIEEYGNQLLVVSEYFNDNL